MEDDTLTTTALPYDPAKFEAAIGRFLGDVGAVLTAASVLIGDKLGLYKALAEAGAQTSQEVAKKTGTHERYVREWLANQAAAGYVTYDPATKRFALPAEHIPLLADDESEVNMCALFGMGQPLFVDEPRITEAFKTGKGVGWHEHDAQSLRRDGPHLSQRLCLAFSRPLDSGTRRSRREAAHGRTSCRRRLRLWQLDDPDGEGIPDVARSSATTITSPRSPQRERRLVQPACRKTRNSK